MKRHTIRGLGHVYHITTPKYCFSQQIRSTISHLLKCNSLDIQKDDTTSLGPFQFAKVKGHYNKYLLMLLPQ
jgi:hypothetical protein